MDHTLRRDLFNGVIHVPRVSSEEHGELPPRLDSSSRAPEVAVRLGVANGHPLRPNF